MRISRRPKSLASIENEPGPIIASASEITTASNDAALLSKNFVVGEANQGVEPASMPRATRRLEIGVMNPASTQRPNGSRTTAFASEAQLDKWTRHRYPWPSAETPTIARSSSSATADQPFGKVESQTRTRSSATGQRYSQ